MITLAVDVDGVCADLHAEWLKRYNAEFGDNLTIDRIPATASPRTSAPPVSEKEQSALPVHSAARKDVPLARGVLDYFPAALAAIAELSKAGNDKHNPGEELHWARGKSMDHADCIMRHLADRGTIDPSDGKSHTVKVAWRALALLQEEEETMRGAPLPRGARAP